MLFLYKKQIARKAIVFYPKRTVADCYARKQQASADRHFPQLSDREENS